MTYDITATHAMNKFALAKLVEAGFIDLSKYKGMTPIIPTQQQPEMTSLATNIPFIVYNYASNGEDVDWWIEHEQVAYVVYSDQEKQIRQIITYLKQLFSRYEWAADEINNYLRANGSAAQKEFDFKYVRVLNATGIEPATEEGGRMSALISANICFTSNLNQQGMRA